MNKKFLTDIKSLPKQFKVGLEICQTKSFQNKIKKIVVCGMGGSAFYVEVLNNFLITFSSFQIVIIRDYQVPQSLVSEDTLFLLISYSGNTEEVISNLYSLSQQGVHIAVITTGGELSDIATKKSVTLLKIPKGIQPRLAMGYLLGINVGVLVETIFPEKKEDIVNQFNIAFDNLDLNFDQEKAKEIAALMLEHTPIFYTTSNISSLAQISKIKFNENLKRMAFWNVFPELNHNEMIGFENQNFNPSIFIFKSKFTDKRNLKRIDVFIEIMQSKNTKVIVETLAGKSVLEEIINGCYFIDHVSYYIAEELKIDPEEVELIQQFKILIKD